MLFRACIEVCRGDRRIRRSLSLRHNRCWLARSPGEWQHACGCRPVRAAEEMAGFVSDDYVPLPNF